MRNTPPDFRMVVQQGQLDVGRGEIMFSSLLDQGKPVVLNFWAGLCPPCRAEMPGFQAAYDTFRKDIILVGVDVGSMVNLGTEDDARRLLEEFDITYPAATAVGDPLTPYGVHGMPSTLFFAHDGTLVDTHSGYLSETDLRQTITRLLQDAKGNT